MAGKAKTQPASWSPHRRKYSSTPQARAHLAGRCSAPSWLCHPTGVAPWLVGGVPFPEDWAIWATCCILHPQRHQPLRPRQQRLPLLQGGQNPPCFVSQLLAGPGGMGCDHDHPPPRHPGVTAVAQRTEVLHTGQTFLLRTSSQGSAASQGPVCVGNEFPTPKLSYSPSGPLYNFPKAGSCQPTYSSLPTHREPAKRPPVPPLSTHTRVGTQASRQAPLPAHTSSTHPGGCGTEEHKLQPNPWQTAAFDLFPGTPVRAVRCGRGSAGRCHGATRGSRWWRAEPGCTKRGGRCAARLPCREPPAWNTHHTHIS